MPVLEQLGAAPPASDLSAEDIALLDLILAERWGNFPLNWKLAISAAQLETMVAGMLSRALSSRAAMPTGKAIQYLLSKTSPNAGGEGGGNQPPAISSEAGNAIIMNPDGLYVKEPSWTVKGW